jgi:hypothetical protein
MFEGLDVDRSGDRVLEGEFGVLDGKPGDGTMPQYGHYRTGRKTPSG